MYFQQVMSASLTPFGFPFFWSHLVKKMKMDEYWSKSRNITGQTVKNLLKYWQRKLRLQITYYSIFGSQRVARRPSLLKDIWWYASPYASIHLIITDKMNERYTTAPTFEQIPLTSFFLLFDIRLLLSMHFARIWENGHRLSKGF